MNKLGSEFIKPFDNYERPVAFNLTKRQLVMFLGLLLIVSLTVGISFMGLSDIFMYLVALVLAPPFMIYGFGFDEGLKEKIMFNLKVQKRPFLTEFREGETVTRNDFKMGKQIKETN